MQLLLRYSWHSNVNMYARIIPSELWKNSWDFNNSMERVEVPFFIKQFEFLDNSLRGSIGVRSYECHEYAPNSQVGHRDSTEQKTKLSITRSILELEAWNFAWTFVWIVRTHYKSTKVQKST